MENTILLNLLEKILGKSDKKARENYAFMCPNKCHATKKKLEINLETGQWECWICSTKSNFKGKTIKSLLKRINVSQIYIDELKYVNPSVKIPVPYRNELKFELPKEFISLKDNIKDKYNNTLSKHALAYLKKRNINNDDIVKYNIGFCPEGKYSNRIIIPSYDSKGKINYFIARTYIDDSFKYLNPYLPNKDIIGFELYINWNLPIILCEGAFDAIAIKRNVIPLFGKKISDALMKKIITSQVKSIYLTLDQDARTDMLNHAEMLLNVGKKVYIVEIKDKDPSQLGFKKFTELIQNATPLYFSDLIDKKLDIY